MIQARLLASAVLAGSTLIGGTLADAKTVKFPENAPQVTFEVPDDWTVTAAPIGLEVAPTDKSALIVAGFAKRDRASLTKWHKDATQRMEAFGVVFDPKAKAPTKVSVAPTTLFSGTPSIGVPEQGPAATTAFEDKKMAGLPLEDLTGHAPPKGAKLRYNALVIYGASYLNTPVDAELLDFALSPKQLFLMQQESGKTDTRIAAIIESVRSPEK